MSRRGRRKSGAGAFFGGTFFGFLLGLGAVAGVGAFAYFKASPAWINETFNAEINLGNEEINSKTLNDVVNTIKGISENSDTYSFNDLKNDFGVELPNELMGISIEDLKDVPLSKLADAAQNKLTNISAKELENLFSSEALDNIMSETVTFYYDGTKLYSEYDGSTYSQEATFDYTIDNGQVKIKNFAPVSIGVDDMVDIKLETLPLSVALDLYVGSMGDNLTLSDLKTSYGVNLPDFIYVGHENDSVNELSNIINDLTVSKMLSVNPKFDTSTKKYFNDKNNNTAKDDGEEEVSSLVAAIADSKIGEISGKLNELTLDKVFPNRTGVLSLISNPEKVLLTGEAHDDLITIQTAIQNAINNSTLEDLLDSGVINNPQLNAIKDKWLNVNFTTPMAPAEYVQVKSLKLNELITIATTAMNLSGALQDTNPNA